MKNEKWLLPIIEEIAALALRHEKMRVEDEQGNSIFSLFYTVLNDFVKEGHSLLKWSLITDCNDNNKVRELRFISWE